jgi:Flp pilus assembly protein TadB
MEKKLIILSICCAILFIFGVIVMQISFLAVIGFLIIIVALVVIITKIVPAIGHYYKCSQRTAEATEEIRDLLKKEK